MAGQLLVLQKQVTVFSVVLKNYCKKFQDWHFVPTLSFLSKLTIFLLTEEELWRSNLQAIQFCIILSPSCLLNSSWDIQSDLENAPTWLLLASENTQIVLEKFHKLFLLDADVKWRKIAKNVSTKQSVWRIFLSWD